MMAKAVAAAGAVVLRSTEAGDEVALVHRPRYDDWGLPKGKVSRAELLPVTAVREVLEETGIKIRLGYPLDQTSYSVGNSQKKVNWWVGHVVREGHWKPSKEIDHMQWVNVQQALRQLSYPAERRTLRAALQAPHTTPLLVIRHAKALERRHWNGVDLDRPLIARGHRQSRELADLLLSYRPTALVSSPAERCDDTFTPYAHFAQLVVEHDSILSEDEGLQDFPGVTAGMQKIAMRAVLARQPLALCGHRPLLPTMLEAVGIVPKPMGTSDVFIAHLDDQAETVAVEFHESPH